jgi:uroporphyrinogen-III decarboxylase
MLHCHGKIGNVLSGLKNIGFDSIHPIEAPPMGDCTLAKAREVFGKDTILVGNIQYGDLWEKTEEEMEYLVQTALKEGAETGRFILATTGGPSAPEINDNVVKNYRRIIKTVIDN